MVTPAGSCSSNPYVARDSEGRSQGRVNWFSTGIRPCRSHTRRTRPHRHPAASVSSVKPLGLRCSRATSDRLNQGLALAALGLVGIRAMAWVGWRSFPLYFAVGAMVGIAVDASGVHATVTGVILGLLAPARGSAPRRLACWPAAACSQASGSRWPCLLPTWPFTKASSPAPSWG